MKNETELEQLKRKLEQRTRELSALQQAAWVFGAMSEGEDIYAQLTEQAAQLLDAEMCAILLYDEKEQALVSQIPAYGLSDEVARAYRVPLEDEAIWEMWQTNEYLALNDVTNDPLVMALGLKPLAEALGVWSTLMVLMRVEGRGLGVIQPSNKRDGTGFNEDDIRLLSIFASQVAVAIENVRLLSEARKRTEEMKLLYEVGVAASSSLDLGEIMTSLTDSARLLTDADYSHIYIIDKATGLYTYKITLERPELKTDEGEIIMPTPRPGGYTEAIIKNGEPLVIDDVSKYPNMHPFALQQGIRSQMAVPILVDGQTAGAIFNSSTEVSHFTEHDLVLLSFLASQAAVSIKNAQLFAQMNQALEELRATSAEQARLLEAVRELSTPLVPVTDNILVLPLIGSIDSRRAQQIMGSLLAGIVERGAEVVIIDITGVPTVDTAIADHLLRATQAAALLGCQTILVGITPQVAHTIVQLGVDLSGQITRSDLQSGIAYALHLLGRRIMPVQ